MRGLDDLWSSIHLRMQQARFSRRCLGTSSSTPANTTGSWWCTTAWPGWCRRSRGRRSKLRERIRNSRVPQLPRRRSAGLARPFTLKSLWRKRKNFDTTRRQLRPKWQAALGRGPRDVRGRAPFERQAQVLRAGDAALSERPAPHGPRAQLLHWRRAGAPHVDARLQRAAPDGVGCVRAARRKRRDQEQHASARVDARATSPP